MISLRIFVCRHFRADVDAAVKRAELSGVEVFDFAPDCMRPVEDWADLPASFHDRGLKHPRLLIGGTCLSLLRQTSEIERPAAILSNDDTCAEMLAGHDAVENLRNKGALPLNAGNLRVWHDCSTDEQARAQAARQMAAERPGPVVLLDTGIHPDAGELLEAFGQAADRPFETRFVGIDHLALLLRGHVLEAQLAAQRERASESASETQRHMAKYAMSIDLLSDLASLDTEEEVVHRILDLSTMLFAPKALCYTPVRDGHLGEPLWKGAIDEASPHETERFVESRAPYMWLANRRGFLVRLFHGRETVGVLSVGDVAFPNNREHYLNQSLSMAGLLAMAVRNARSRQEMEQADAERRELTRRLQKAQRLDSLRQMAGGVAHHLNNILQSMVGFCELAIEEIGPESPGKRWIEEIRGLTSRASRLSSEMLACAGQPAVRMQLLDLSDLVEELAPLLRTSQPVSVTLETELAAQLPPVKADIAQLRQILSNIVANSFEALEGGRGCVTIRTGCEELDREFVFANWPAENIEPGPHVYMQIVDDGPGMDAKTRERVFDPFFSTKLVGRGLGLAAVLGTVRAHGGAVLVESQPDEGTTLTVYFPAQAQPTAPAPQPARAPVPATGQGTRILLVDDEENVLKLTGRMLEKAEYRVVQARDGAEALLAIRQADRPFDCVLLDITMPNVDGIACLKEIREKWAELPVIISTGHRREDVADRLEPFRVQGFIQKPYQSAELRDAIEQALQ